MKIIINMYLNVNECLDVRWDKSQIRLHHRGEDTTVVSVTHVLELLWTNLDNSE